MISTTYDPFTWRIAELHALTAEPTRDSSARQQLETDILVAEAEELAHGRRHLTIAHGEPADIAEVTELDEFYDTVFELAKGADWHRIRGTTTYVTITASGDTKDQVLAQIAHVARVRCSSWRSLLAVRPD